MVLRNYTFSFDGFRLFLRLIKLIDETTISKLNTLVFKLFLPVLIFKNIYSTDLAQGFDFNIIGYAIIVSIICYLLIFLVIFLIEKDKKTAVLIQEYLEQTLLFLVYL